MQGLHTAKLSPFQHRRRANPAAVLVNLARLLMVLALVCRTAGWFSTGSVTYARRVQFSFNYEGDVFASGGDSTSLVLTLKLNETMLDVPGDVVYSPTAAVPVKDDDSSILPFTTELVEGNEMWIHVRVSDVEKGSNYFWVYYGDASAVSYSFTAAEVWAEMTSVIEFSDGQVTPLTDQLSSMTWTLQKASAFAQDPSKIAGAVAYGFDFSDSIASTRGIYTASLDSLGDGSLWVSIWAFLPGTLSGGNVCGRATTTYMTLFSIVDANDKMVLVISVNAACSEVVLISGSTEHGQYSSEVTYQAIGANINVDKWTRFDIVVATESVGISVNGEALVYFAKPLNEFSRTGPFTFALGGSTLSSVTRCQYEWICTQGSPTVKYTLLDWPGSVDNFFFGININPSGISGGYIQEALKNEIQAMHGSDVEMLYARSSACRPFSLASSTFESSTIALAGETPTFKLYPKDSTNADVPSNCADSARVPYVKVTAGGQELSGAMSWSSAENAYVGGPKLKVGGVFSAVAYTETQGGKAAETSTSSIKWTVNGGSLSTKVSRVHIPAIVSWDSGKFRMKVVTKDQYGNVRTDANDKITLEDQGSAMSLKEYSSTLVRDLSVEYDEHAYWDVTVHFDGQVGGGYLELEVGVNGEHLKDGDVYTFAFNYSMFFGLFIPTLCICCLCFTGISITAIIAFIPAISRYLRKPKNEIDLRPYVYELPNGHTLDQQHSSSGLSQLAGLLNTTMGSGVSLCILEGVEAAKVQELLRAVLMFYNVAVYDKQQETLGRAQVRKSLGGPSMPSLNPSIVYHPYDPAVDLVLRLLLTQLATEKQPDSLFRVDTKATKALRMYMFMVGLPYLHKTIHGPLSDVVEWAARGKAAVEMDPSRMGEDEDADGNLWTLMSLAQRVLVEILKSRNSVPIEFRRIARVLFHAVKEKFPDHEMCGSNAMANMFFLRFYCAAVLSPHIFGLQEEAPSGNVQRSLMLIAKVLQNLANGVQFGGKEKFMLPLNQFIDRNRPKVESFYHDMANTDPLHQLTGADPSVFVPPSETTERMKKFKVHEVTTPRVLPTLESRAWPMNAVASVLGVRLDQISNVENFVLEAETMQMLVECAVALRPAVPDPANTIMSGNLKHRSAKGKLKPVFVMLTERYIWVTKSKADMQIPKAVFVLDGSVVLEDDTAGEADGQLAESISMPASTDKKGRKRSGKRESAMTDVTVASDKDEKGSRRSKKLVVDGSCKFLVDSPIAGTEHFVAASEDDRARWVNAIKGAISLLRYVEQDSISRSGVRRSDRTSGRSSGRSSGRRSGGKTSHRSGWIKTFGTGKLSKSRSWKVDKEGAHKRNTDLSGRSQAKSDLSKSLLERGHSSSSVVKCDIEFSTYSVEMGRADSVLPSFMANINETEADLDEDQEPMNTRKPSVVQFPEEIERIEDEESKAPRFYDGRVSSPPRTLEAVLQTTEDGRQFFVDGNNNTSWHRPPVDSIRFTGQDLLAIDAREFLSADVDITDILTAHTSAAGRLSIGTDHGDGPPPTYHPNLVTHQEERVERAGSLYDSVESQGIN